MIVVDIREARVRLSNLIEQAVRGEAFVIAKAGRPLVKVIAVHAPERRRLGFLAGEVVVPDDFNSMGAARIKGLLGAQRGWSR